LFSLRIFAWHYKEQIDDLKDCNAVRDEQEDKPPFFSALCCGPKRYPFPR